MTKENSISNQGTFIPIHLLSCLRVHSLDCDIPDASLDVVIYNLLTCVPEWACALNLHDLIPAKTDTIRGAQDLAVALWLWP